ncbi:hypothetical protein EDB84DRAFT_1556745 [Lactarius hengduanensis]|nr:hypothetical protein EDB84DRAFT_1556745 [Lactarius hengduanensis]
MDSRDNEKHLPLEGFDGSPHPHIRSLFSRDAPIYDLNGGRRSSNLSILRLHSYPDTTPTAADTMVPSWPPPHTRRTPIHTAGVIPIKSCAPIATLQQRYHHGNPTHLIWGNGVRVDLQIHQSGGRSIV